MPLILGILELVRHHQRRRITAVDRECRPMVLTAVLTIWAVSRCALVVLASGTRPGLPLRQDQTNPHLLRFSAVPEGVRPTEVALGVLPV